MPTNVEQRETAAIPSLGQRLSWIWLICGLGLLLMGGTSSWNDAAFTRPEAHALGVYTGQLQKVTFSAPAKSPTSVEVLIYNKRDGLKHGYLRYGLHAWEERIKPYQHQDISLWLDKDLQIWAVEVKGKDLLSTYEIEGRLQSMKKSQQAMADNIVYAGLFILLSWLLFFRPPSFRRSEA